MSWLGIDIGGANLKVANANGWARSTPFPLWRTRDGLPRALAEIIDSAPAADHLAVTMTGELCDCYRTKTEGVRHILSSVKQCANDRSVAVYLTDGRFASLSEAYEVPTLAAARNWRAIAEYACTRVGPSDGLLVDIGSTTTDIIPIAAGKVVAQGRTDIERLLAHELVYTGIGRTPVCAVTNVLPWKGRLCPVAAELFATTADAYLLLELVEEDRTATWTADGRPLTREFAKERLARQLCANADEIADAEFAAMAEAVRHSQLQMLCNALSKFATNPPATVVLSGLGEFLAKPAIQSTFPGSIQISLSETIGPAASQAAAAYALAVLASEMCRGQCHTDC
ncbi:MAG TPA: hydantoinase/oxoprolinase family protein [Pirellulales bacterium]